MMTGAWNRHSSPGVSSAIGQAESRMHRQVVPRRHALRALTALLPVLVAGCARTPGDLVAPAAQAEELRSGQARAQPQVPPADQQALVADQNAFVLDLYRLLREQDGNVFFS